MELRAACHRLCQLDESEYLSGGRTNEQIRDGILLAWAWDKLLAWNARQGESLPIMEALAIPNNEQPRLPEHLTRLLGKK